MGWVDVMRWYHSRFEPFSLLPEANRLEPLANECFPAEDIHTNTSSCAQRVDVPNKVMTACDETKSAGVRCMLEAGVAHSSSL